ncbi:MAG TPA: energy-coupling factor transporter transmembrane component T [Solirubrobacteraceae bacterium]|nr:energy-coupling factor transporter transmembrane component T [Solirubrobacteraceae bacterium]
MRAAIAYRHRPTALHACRATVAASFGASIVLAALIAANPVVLAALLVAVCGAASLASVAREVRTAAAWTLVPLVAMTVIVNLLVSREGLTVFARLGDWAVLGQVNLTLEALVYGLVTALRIVIVVLACVLAYCTADPDELLAASRRWLPHSGLAAVLGTRMLPVLAADAARLSQAQRCRADGGATGARARLAILRATVQGALDRSLDVAAVLEMRGYGAGRRTRREHEPLSRHDIAFAAAAAAIVALALASTALASASFSVYPLIRAHFGFTALALGAATVCAALLPFLDQRGVER